MLKGTKGYLLVLIVVLLIITSSGCGREVTPKKNKPTIEGDLRSYFPTNTGMILKYAGVGNEFASFTRKIKFKDNNLKFIRK